MHQPDPSPYFAELARRLVAIDGVQETMAAIVQAAVEVTGCDHASLSHLRNRQLISASSNDEVGPVLDAIQTETQEGPCLDAIRSGGVVVVDDLTQDPRFPAYGPRAVEATGVRSSMATQLHDGRRTVGALNLFSEGVARFAGDPQQEALVAILAAHGTLALAAALFRENIAQALKTRDLIGQAKGMLMARAAIDEDEAFGLLVGASQRMNVKLVELARSVVKGEHDLGYDPEVGAP